jgi:GEVED domain/Ig-like domain CHU_C associated/Secretion system C-terminal sorting domain
MRLKLLVVVLCGFLSSLGFAQTTVTITASSGPLLTGSVTAGGVTNDGNMVTINSGANRGWAYYDLSSIPYGAIVSSATMYYTTYSSVSSTAVNTVTGFVGNPSVMAGATLYASIGSGTVMNSSNWTANALNTKVVTPAGLTLIQNNCGANLTLGYVRGSTNTYNIYGYPGLAADQPKLEITYTLPPACAGMPNPGATNASTASACPAATVNLTLPALVAELGLTFQWQNSTDGVSYNNIAGATAAAYSTTQSVPTYYQCIVTCSNTSQSATSTPVMVATTPFDNCYCTSIPTSTIDEDIYNVTINGGSTDPLYANANNCTTAAPGPGSILARYANFKTLPPITSVAPGQSVSLSIYQDECNAGTYYQNGIAVWIDFNQNGSYSDPGEQVYLDPVTVQGPRTINATVNIPMSALVGNTTMRIICAENFAGAALQPCMTYVYGETEDYLITIECPTLNGVTALDAGVCSGNTVTLNGTTSNPLATISWWDSPVGGTQIGSGPSYTSGALVANTDFYVQEDFPNCPSSVRDTVSVTVTAVDVTLAPVDVTCNGGDNGSFTQTSVLCGNPAFSYSVNGGPFGPIPTNLTAGTYSVVVQDGSSALSVPYQVIISEPAAPTALTATNVTYYNADLGWTTTGNETSWTVIYGPAGFDPATSGTVVPTTTNPLQLTGVLTADTQYDFYVFATCGPVPDTAGPLTFATDPGFYTYDNQCGPAFVDISTTGTNLSLVDDSEAGVTLPWAWNVNGTTVNTITVGNNGGVVFNTLTGNVGYTAFGNGFFPFVQDLNTAEPGGGVFWESVGVAPNRQLIIMWKDLSHYTFPAATNGSTFELIVEESGDVYYVYQDVMFGNPAWDNGADAEIAAITANGTVTVSTNNATYLTSNQCVHLYNELCPNPTGLTSLIFANDAILDWNPGLYGEGNWTLVYGPAGFDPALAGQAIDTFDLIFSDAGFGGTLTQLTEYDVYIYSECAADNLTSPGLFFNFTTLPYCSIPSALAGTTDVDSLELTWNWTASSPTYPVTGFNISYVMAGNGGAYDGVEVDAIGINYADTVFNTNLLAGGVYNVYVQAECAGTNDTSSYFGPITLVMPLSNDTVCGAENLAVDGTLYTFNNNGATVSVNEAPIAPPADGAQVTTGWTNSTLNGTTWFTFVAPASGSVRVNGNAINYNGQIAVYEAIDCGDFATFTLVAANDNEIDGPSLAPNFTICGLTPGDTYYLMQDGFTAATGNYSITITPIVLEAGTANPVTDICTGSDIDLFTTVAGNNPGGVWSSDIASVNASISGSDFASTGLAYNVFDFQYRVTDGCAYDSIITQVHVYPPSNAGEDGTITTCRNQPIDLLSGLSGTADLNGTWYNPSNNPISSSAIVASDIAGQFNYDYIVGNGVCPDDTANVVVEVLPTCNYLEVADELFYGVSLFPNPSEGTVFIASDATQSFDYVVTDANGRIISEMSNGIKAAQTTEINLNNMETGVYFIKLSNDQAEKVFRVVIQ